MSGTHSFFCIVLAFSLLCCSAIGDEENEVRFRRIKVPIGDVEKYITGLLPRRRDEFERLVEMQVTPRCAFESAKYDAKFADGTLSGTCELKKLATRQSSAESSPFLELGGEIAIDNPVWKSSESNRTALVGRANALAGGQTLVANDAADVLAFDWSQVGLIANAERSVIRFELTFPNAFRHELQVELPRDLKLLASHGVTSSPQSLDDSFSSDSNIWTVHWSGVNTLRLTVLPVTSMVEMPPFDVRSRSAYFFRSTGIQLESTLSLRLNPSLPAPETFRVEVDPSLNVNSIRYNETPLRWTQAISTTDAYDVVMPTAFSGKQLDIEIDATANYPPDEQFDLPRISTQGRWISEQVKWSAYSPITVADIQAQGTHCESIKPATAGGAETMEFVLESEDSSLQLRILRDASELSLETFVRAAVNEKSIVADVEARFAPEGKEIFEVLFDVDTKSGWVFGSVEALADTEVLGLTGSVMDRLEREPGENGERIRVFLKQAATADRPLSLKLRLQNNTIGGTVALPKLLPVSFPDVGEVATWIYVRANPSVDLKVNGGEHADWVEPDRDEVPAWMANIVAEGNGIANSLTPSEILSDDSIGEDILFRHQRRSKLSEIVRKSKPALLRVNTEMRVDILEEETRYAYEWSIDPLGEEVNHVDLLFSSPIIDSLWSLADRSELPKLDELEAKSTDDPDWVRYRVMFDGIDKPFKLQFRFGEPSRDMVQVPLSTVDETSSERAYVALYASGTIGLDVEPGDGLNAIPLEIFDRRVDPSEFTANERDDTEGERLRSAYTYDKATSNLIPSLKLTNKPMPIQSALIAWRCDVRSFYSEKGRPRHRADFFLQNDGVGKFRIDFPKGYALDDVEIDGEKLSPHPRLSTDGMLFLTLPSTNRFPCVSIRYVQPERSLGAIDWLTSPIQMSPLSDRDSRDAETEIPRSNVSCLQTTWQVWLPRDYQTYSSLMNASNDSWSERLFGSFGSSSGPEFLTVAWRSIRRRLIPDNGSSSIIDQAKSLLGPDWVGNRKGRSKETNTWGGRLREIDRAIGRSQGDDFKLFIDREELRRVGVFSDTPLPSTRYTKARQMGVDRLVQAGLAIVLDGQCAIITSASEVKERSAGSQLIDGIAVEGDASWFPMSRLHSVKTWQEDTGPELWHPSSDALEIGFHQGGWVSSRRNVDNTATSLRIFHRDTAVAFSCSLFFVGYAIGWMSFANRRRWLILLVSGFVLALLLPKPGASLAVAFGWSILLSGLLRWMLRSNKGSNDGELSEPAARRFAPTRAAVLLLACTFAVLTSQSLKAQVAPQTRDSKTKESFVYFPYNKDESLSDYVYVSPSFDQVLNQRQRELLLNPDHLFRSATYSGTWPAEATAKSLTFVANYDVTTFAANTLVRPPLEDQQGALRVDRATISVDGVVLAPETDGSLLIARPGDHRIVVRCLAAVSRRNDQRQTKFSIPPMTNSRLQISLPRGVESVVVPSAVSMGSVDTNRGILSADLGASSDLDVRVTRPTTTEEPLDQVDQLILLKITKDDAELETRFRFAGRERPLKLKVDKQLIPRFESASYGDWNPDRLEFDTDLLDANDGIRFGVPLPTTLGRFRIPIVSPIDTPVRSTQLAVVTTPEILATFTAGDAEILPREEFAGVWGDLEKNPDVVFDVDEGYPELRIVHAQQTENWNSDIAFYFDAGQTEFVASIQLVPISPKPSVVTVRRFTVPAGLEVGDVRASTSLGVPLRIRWHASEDSVSLFFLDQPEISQAVPIDLSIEGVLDDDVDELPLIGTGSPSTDTFVSQNIVLYRADNVRLTPESPFIVAANPNFTSKRQGYRYAASWSGELSALDDEPIDFVVRKSFVQQNLTGSLLTSLRRDADGWATEISATVKGDDVDAIHFDVPKRLVETVPVASEGDFDLSVDVSGGAGLDRRTVTVWLPLSSETERKVSLVARMPENQIQLPHVDFVNVEIASKNGRRQQFVELPSQSSDDANSRFEWRWSGLVAAGQASETTARRFRVTRNDFSAELTELRTGDNAEIFLLETTASWRPASNAFFVMAQFDLKPAKLREVLIELPLQAELIQVMCDEVPSYTTEIHDDDAVRKYRIPLTAAPWPQRLRVVYRTKQKTLHARELRLDAPRLLANSANSNRRLPIPIRNKLWNVYSSQLDRFAKPRFSKAEILEADDVDDLLLKSFSDLWDNSQVSLREDRDDKSAWLRTWAARLDGVLRRVKQREDFVTDPNMTTINQLLLDYPDVFEPELYAPELLDIYAAGRTSQQVLPEELWDESQWLSGILLQYSSPGETEAADIDGFPSLRIARLDSYVPSLGRYLIAGLLVACALVLPQWRPMARVGEFCQRYPHLVVMGLGLGWWTLLTPSWIGLLIFFGVAAIWVGISLRNRRRNPSS